MSWTFASIGQAGSEASDPEAAAKRGRAKPDQAQESAGECVRFPLVERLAALVRDEEAVLPSAPR